MEPARTTRRWLIGLAVALAVLVPAGWWATHHTDPPGEQARPIEAPGLTNAFRVDGRVYRGAAPDDAGLAWLKGQGVQTVIDLAGMPGERERVEAAGMEYVAIPSVSYRLEPEKVARFLEVVGDETRGPFFVHCAEGRFRTSTAVAAYRIRECGWTEAEAIDEMVDGGHDFTEPRELVEEYFRTNPLP